jgi:PhzF family phenazine biosynthesis protein
MGLADPEEEGSTESGHRLPDPSSVHIWIYASFTSEIGGGNPAGVVLSASPIRTATAQQLASTLGFPTTAFAVCAPGRSSDAVDARFFTPEREIDACGHATVALALALVDAGAWQSGRHGMVRGGTASFEVRPDGGSVAMTFRSRSLGSCPLDWGDVEAALGRLRQGAFPLAVADCGLRHLIVPLASPEDLGHAQLDARRIRHLARGADVDTICLWAPTETGGRYRMRDLCAAIGALEEPASGTTSAALGAYLASHRGSARMHVAIEQGVEMGRPSRLEVTIDRDHAIVRGTGRKVASGSVFLTNGGIER